MKKDYRGLTNVLSGVSHVTYGVAAKVRARQVVEDSLGGVCRAGEHASGLQLLKAILIWKFVGWCASQLNLHVGVYDAGRQGCNLCTIGLESFV